MTTKKPADGCDVGGIEANQNLPARHSATASKSQLKDPRFLALGEVVFVGASLTGDITETAEGWSAFDTSGRLIGIRQCRAVTAWKVEDIRDWIERLGR
jgi:hypothetical protein